MKQKTKNDSKLANRILTAFLAFVDTVSPLLAFLCIRKPDTDDISGVVSQIS